MKHSIMRAYITSRAPHCSRSHPRYFVGRILTATFILAFAGCAFATIDQPAVLNGLFGGAPAAPNSFAATGPYPIYVTGNTLKITGGDRCRARLSSGTSSPWDASDLTSTYLSELVVDSSASILIGQSSSWLLSGNDNIFFFQCKKGANFNTAALGATVPFAIDATTTSFKIFSPYSLALTVNGASVSPTFRYMNGTTQSSSSLGVTCTVAVGSITGLGSCGDLTSTAVCSWTPTVTTCTKSGTYLNFLMPGFLEVEEDTFGGSSGSFRVIQRVAPYFVPDSTIQRPGSGPLNVSVNAYGAFTEKADDSCAGLTTVGSSAFCAITYAIDTTTYPNDVINAGWGSSVAKWDESRTPRVFFTTLEGDGDAGDAANRPNRPGILTLQSSAKIGWVLPRAAGGGRGYNLTLAGNLANVTRVYPLITEVGSPVLTNANPSSIVVSGWHFGTVTANIGLDVWWESASDTQTITGCVLGTTSNRGENSWTCSSPLLARAGDAKFRMFTTRQGYTPDYNTTVAQITVQPVITSTSPSNTAISHPSSNQLTTVTVNGAGFKGATRADAGTAAGTCSGAGWTLNAAGTAFSCATLNIANAAGTVQFQLTYPGTTTVLNTFTTTKPVLTITAVNRTATTSGTFSFGGSGIGDSTTGATGNLVFQAGALSLSGASNFGVVTNYVRNTGGTSLTVNMDANNRARDGGPFYGVYTINSQASTAIQVASFTPVVMSSGDSVQADVASTDLALAGWGIGPAPLVTFNVTYAGACTSGSLSGSPGANGYTWSCAHTLEPAAAGSFYANIGSGGYRTAGTFVRTYKPTVVATSGTQIINASSTLFTLTGYGLGTSDAAVPGGVLATFGLSAPTCNKTPGSHTNNRIGSQGSVTFTCLAAFPQAGTLPINSLTVNGVAADNLPKNIAQLRASIGSFTPQDVPITSVTSTAITIPGGGLQGASITLDTFAIQGGNTQGSLTCQTLTSTATSLSCTLNQAPDTAGPLSATITVAGSVVGNFVVARILPVITANSGDLQATFTSLGITAAGMVNGAAPSVSFSQASNGNGAGVVVASPSVASGNSITCTVTTGPTHSSTLYAQITVLGVASAWQQVGNILPVWSVTPPNRNVGATTGSISITGNGLCAGTFPTCSAPTTTIQAPHAGYFSGSPCGTISGNTATGFSCSLTSSVSEIGRVRLAITTAGTSTTINTLFFAIPVVTPSSSAVAATATSLVITTPFLTSTQVASASVTFVQVSGYTPSCLSVTIGSGQVTCNGLDLRFGGALSISAFSVTTVVGSDVLSASISTTSVATVTPVITSSNNPACDYATGSCTVTLSGNGFLNAVAVSDGTPTSGATFQAPTSITATGLTVAVDVSSPTRAGTIGGRVTAGSTTSASFNICTFRPIIISNSPTVPSVTGPAAGNSAWHFDVIGGPYTAGTTLSFGSSGAAASCSVTNVTALACDLTARPTFAGVLQASVTANGANSASVSNVALVQPVVEELQRIQANFIPIDASNPVLTIQGWSIGGTFSMSFASGISCGGGFSAAAAIGGGDTTNKLRLTCTGLSSLPTLAGAYNATAYSANGVSSSVAGYLPAVAYFHPTIDASTATTTWQVETDTFTVTGRGFTTPATLTLASGTCQTVTALSPTSLECNVGSNPANKPAGAGILQATAGVAGLTGVLTNAITVLPYINSITFSSGSNNFAINNAPQRINFAGLALANAGGIASSSNGFATCGIFSRTATSFSCGNTSFPVRPSVPGTVSISIWGINGALASNTFTYSGATVSPVVDVIGGSVAADASSFTIQGHGLNCNGARSVAIVNGGSCTISAGSPASYSYGTAHTATCTLSTTDRLVRHGPLRLTVTCDSAVSAQGTAGTVVPVVFPNPVNDTFTFPIPTYPATTVWEGLALLPSSGNDVTTAVYLDSARGMSCSAATASVVDSTKQRIVCTLSGTPAGPGPVTAQVGFSVSFLSPSQSVFYLAPSINMQTTLYGQSANTLIFNGNGLNVALAAMSINIRTIRAIDSVPINQACTPLSISGSLPTTVTCSFGSGKREPGVATAFVTAAGVTGAPVQVATITADPEVTTQSSTILAVNAPRFNITGRNFGVGLPTSSTNRNLAVALTLGSAQASPYNCDLETVIDTQITCVLRTTGGTFPSGTTLIATVTRNDGAAPATVIYNLVPKPTITSLVDGILFNTTTLRLAGSNLGNSLADIRATLTLGAQTRTCLSSGSVDCTITSAQGSYIDVSFTAFTVAPPYESLNALVVRALGPTDNVQVRTLGYAPLVDSSTDILSTLADRMTLTGQNFYAVAPERNIVILSSGQCVPQSATPSQIVCQILGTPLPPGPLSVLTITSNGIRGANSGVTVRSVLSVPVIFASTRGIQRNSAKMSYSADPVVPDNYLVIRGSGFSTNAASLRVNLSPGTVGCTVQEAKSSYITCLTNSTFSVLGPVYATVTRDQLSSGNAIQIGTVRDVPTVRASAVVISDVATALIVNGTGMSGYSSDDNVITFNQTGLTCTALGSSDVSVTCRINGRLSVGTLGARVQVDDLAQAGTDFVAVATVVLNPDIVSSTRSIATGTRVIIVAGQGFQSPAGAPTLQLVSTSCSSITVQSDSQLTCTLGGAAPTNGLIVQATGVCVGSVCNTFAARTIATVRDIPTITSATVPVIYSPPDSLTLSIQGTGFSTVAGENNVTLNSGTCVVSSSPPPTETLLVCIVNPFQFRAGLLTAQVTVLGGVTSSVRPILVYTPQFPALTSERKVPINAGELILPGYYFTENVTDIVSVRLTRGGTDAATCQILSSTRTSVTCKLQPKFAALGDFEVSLSMHFVNGSGQRVLYQTPRQVGGTVVPVIYDNELVVASGLGFNTTISLYGAGFIPNQVQPTIRVFRSDGTKKRAVQVDDQLYCDVTGVAADVVNCSLSVPNSQKAGDFFAAVTVDYFDAGSGVEDNYTSSNSLLFTVFPSVNPLTPREYRTDGFSLTFTGVGFSDVISENTITLVPAGLCDVISCTTNQIVCRVVNDTLQNGPLQALVGVRGVFYPPSSAYPRLNVGNVTLNYVAPPTNTGNNNGPNANNTAAPSNETAPTLNTVIAEGLSSGTVAGIVIGIILGVAVVVVIVWVIVGYRRYGSVKEAFTGPFSGGAAAAYKGGRAPRKRAVFRARETAITPPYNAPVKAAPNGAGGDDDAPPPPPPEDSEEAPPPPPDSDEEAPPPPPDDDDTQFEMQRFGTLRVNPEDIFANADGGGDASDENEPAPPPPESDSESDAPPPAPESSDSSEDAPPPPEDDADPFAQDAPAGDIDVDNIFD